MYLRSLTDEFSDLRRSFDQFFEALNGTTSRRPATGAAPGDWVFAPLVESGWTDEYLNLRVVIPGVTDKDVKVTVQGNQISIQGERRAPEDFATGGHSWNQIPYGKFERVLDLPAGLDADKMQAHLHEGFLDIRVPLSSAMKPKQVQISTAKTSKQIAA